MKSSTRQRKSHARRKTESINKLVQRQQQLGDAQDTSQQNIASVAGPGCGELHFSCSRSNRSTRPVFFSSFHTAGKPGSIEPHHQGGQHNIILYNMASLLGAAAEGASPAPAPAPPPSATCNDVRSKGRVTSHGRRFSDRAQQVRVYEGSVSTGCFSRPSVGPAMMRPAGRNNDFCSRLVSHSNARRWPFHSPCNTIHCQQQPIIAHPSACTL